MNKRKKAAVSRKTPENTRNSHSQNTQLIREWLMSTSPRSQVSEEVEGRIIRKLCKEFSPTESRILGALSKLDEFLLNLQNRTCSVAVPGTSRNNNPENRGPTGDRSLGDPCPEALFSTFDFGNLTDSEQEETHYSWPLKFWKNKLPKFLCISFHVLKNERLIETLCVAGFYISKRDDAINAIFTLI